MQQSVQRGVVATVVVGAGCTGLEQLALGWQRPVSSGGAAMDAVVAAC